METRRTSPPPRFRRKPLPSDSSASVAPPLISAYRFDDTPPIITNLRIEPARATDLDDDEPYGVHLELGVITEETATENGKTCNSLAPTQMKEGFQALARIPSTGPRGFQEDTDAPDERQEKEKDLLGTGHMASILAEAEEGSYMESSAHTLAQSGLEPRASTEDTRFAAKNLPDRYGYPDDINLANYVPADAVVTPGVPMAHLAPPVSNMMPMNTPGLENSAEVNSRSYPVYRRVDPPPDSPMVMLSASMATLDMRRELASKRERDIRREWRERDEPVPDPPMVLPRFQSSDNTLYPRREQAAPQETSKEATKEAPKEVQRPGAYPLLPPVQAVRGSDSCYDTDKPTCTLNLVCYRSGANGCDLQQIQCALPTLFPDQQKLEDIIADYKADNKELVYSDDQFFPEMRRLYRFRMCGFFRRWCSLKSLRAFRVLAYTPSTRPTVFPLDDFILQEMLYAYRNPEQITTKQDWIEWVFRLRLKDSRFALEFVEGWNTTRLAIAGAIPCISSCLVGIIWTAMGGDVQSAFTVASFILTISSIILALLAIISSIESSGGLSTSRY